MCVVLVLVKSWCVLFNCSLFVDCFDIICQWSWYSSFSFYCQCLGDCWILMSAFHDFFQQFLYIVCKRRENQFAWYLHCNLIQYFTIWYKCVLYKYVLSALTHFMTPANFLHFWYDTCHISLPVSFPFLICRCSLFPFSFSLKWRAAINNLKT